MPIYKALKNLVFSKLDKDVVAGYTIELEKKFVDKVNADLKSAFPDVDAVLVLVDESTQPEDQKTEKELPTDLTAEAVEEKVKKSTNKKKAGSK